MHHENIEQYNQLVNESRKRKIDGRQHDQVKRFKQQQLGHSFSNANLTTQSHVDRLILNFVVQGLQPLHIVELPEFIELINGLQPNRSVINRKGLRQKITELAAEKKRKLISILKEQAYISTTTDCWSCYGKSYLGVTVHWINKETVERQSACLALRRLKGSHTHDVIASTLEDIHSEFEIRRKIVMTTTDNGSNFVKAFSAFGESASSDVENDVVDSDAEEDADKLCTENLKDFKVHDLTASLTEINALEYHPSPSTLCLPYSEYHSYNGCR